MDPSGFTRTLALATGMVALAASSACGASQNALLSCTGKRVLAASGSSAQAEAMTHFGRAYSRTCRGYSVDYTSNGSAAGRLEFMSGKTDFGGSDSPLGIAMGEGEKARARCAGNEAWNLPMVFGAVAITFNVAGLDSLILDAPTAAKIFTGSIRAWDAPEIAMLNPGQALPAEPIVVIARSDESGTTATFQRYLDIAAGAAWDRGAAESFAGADGVRALGNEGIWAEMRRFAGSISYIAWPFVIKNGLPTASIMTSATSPAVALSVESVSKSIAAVTINPGGNNMIIDTASLHASIRPDAYPIVMTTYEIVCSAYPDPQTSAAVRDFLTAALADGQQDLADSGYVPVPEPVKERLSIAIAAIG